jgi:hypothetical protein
MRTRSRLTTAAALAVSTAALASPAMGTPYQDLRSADARDAARQAMTKDLRHDPRVRTTSSLAGTVSPDVPETEVLQASSPSLDWESAAVGAGAALGLSAISLGAFAGLRHRRSAPAPSRLAH